MRWTLRIVAAVAVALALFVLTPFVAVYRLSRAVEARDVAALQERVNFRAVSVSLSRQLVAAYLDAREGGSGSRDPGPASRDLAIRAGVALADPVVSQLVTPEVFAQLLARGWPESVAEGPGPSGPQALGLRLGSWPEILKIMGTAETHGFRRVLVSYPPSEPQDRQFRLHLRLRGLTWRVVAIDLPDELRRRLAAEIRRRAERNGLLGPSLTGAR